MFDSDDAISTIDKWLGATGTAETTLGKLACRNTFAVARIRNESASVGTLKTVLRYIAEHPAPRRRRKAA